ncbi:hypothetical protein IHE45_01G057800 [Dioscorea alata]|uniref:Uncharacterized protein n=1 Tax=Dioscorea alata TaxID=55571 RepID=A0ACB7WV74_DIOAL|nr:hypothetical protein IHE45_01G057800 [Dioscorea alata]
MDEASTSSVNQSSQFEAPSSSKFKKVKRCDKYDDTSLSMAVESIANAIMQSTNAMIQASNTMKEKFTNVLNQCIANRDPTKDCDVWGMLTDIGITQPLLIKAYVFLVKDPKILEGVIRCPREHRKSLLLDLMGYDHE